MDYVRMRLYDEAGKLFVSILGVGEKLDTEPGAILQLQGRNYQIVGPSTVEMVDGEKIPVLDIKLIAWN